MGIEAPESAPDAPDRVTRLLVAQAFALDEMFFRAAKEAFSTEVCSYYHARKALKAQARCRATLNVLLALRKKGSAEKFSDLSERTIQQLKTPDLPKSYPVGGPPGRRLPRRTPGRRRKVWSSERRARQALAIQTWQPWRKSTGPRTEAGKARSARNALKHGLRSRATIETRREDRRLLGLSVHNIAMAKAILQSSSPGDLSADVYAEARRAKAETCREAKTGACAARNLSIARADFATISDKREGPIPAPFHSIDIGSAPLALIPSRPRITPGIAARRHPPLVDKASPRRGWRIAS
jgi:hypothetical protein